MGSKMEPSLAIDLDSTGFFGRGRRATCLPLLMLRLLRKTSSKDMQVLNCIFEIFSADFAAGDIEERMFRADEFLFHLNNLW